MRIGALEGGGTKMVLAVCNENGEVLDRVSIPTETPEITMPKMIAYFKEQQVEALGIGFFGPVILNEQSPKYGCVGNTPKLAWDRQNILRIQNTFTGDDVALLHTVARHHAGMLGERDGVALDDLRAVLVLAGDLDDDVLLGIVVRDDTGDFAHDGHALGEITCSR